MTLGSRGGAGPGAAAAGVEETGAGPPPEPDDAFLIRGQRLELGDPLPGRTRDGTPVFTALGQHELGPFLFDGARHALILVSGIQIARYLVGGRRSADVHGEHAPEGVIRPDLLGGIE
jgi:hypothetical protein